jgi:hypothetical protein
MTARDAAFTQAVMAATTLCPQIVRAVARAKYANAKWRPQRIADARALLRRLDAELDRAAIVAATEEGEALPRQQAGAESPGQS